MPIPKQKGPQNLPDWKKGKGITARELNSIKDSIAKTIVGGNGIEVKTIGNQVIISQENEQIIPQGIANSTTQYAYWAPWTP